MNGQNEPKGVDMISWRWLAGTLVGVLILGGGGWMTSIHSQVLTIQKDQEGDRKAINEVAKDLAVISERGKRLEQDIRELREEQKQTNAKLDELLRQLRPSR